MLVTSGWSGDKCACLQGRSVVVTVDAPDLVNLLTAPDESPLEPASTIGQEPIADHQADSNHQLRVIHRGEAPRRYWAKPDILPLSRPPPARAAGSGLEKPL